MDAYLERIDPAENCMRFYRFELFRNLFGDWQLDREWGRIGRSGTVSSTIHDDGEDALNCAHAILAYKVGSRHYTVQSLDWSRSNIIGLLPRRKQGVLNLKLCAFFAGHRVFQEMALRMYRHNIFYMGELVQLSPEDVALFMRQKGSDSYAEYFDLIRTRMDELTAALAECDLSLGSKANGWMRPDGESIIPILVGQSLRRRRAQRYARPVAEIHRPDFPLRKKPDQNFTRLIG